ncbi:polymorphic toxin type 50 domain-containing protein [Anaerococcus porci]|nr:polymorphic toxin type 50 domain-containing protein [Anaerococcus porci]MDY3006008.1 polymorphic toxin type 50 domain-containing protein [Anaerococcus porci]
MSVIDNLIRSNADFHYKAGLSPKIIRKSNGHCCDWCSSLVCVYDYKDVKDNGNAVFRRHRHCDCTVIYDPRDGGKKRNVHTHKEWTDSNKDKRLAITARSSSIYIAKEVRKGNLKLNFNKDHYEKHIEGTKRFDDYYKSRINKGYGMQSILSIDYDIAQRLINDNFGKGIVTVTKSGKPRNEENINFNRFIGYYVYRNKRYPTTKGKIIYSKKGSHIVPIKGEDFD